MPPTIKNVAIGPARAGEAEQILKLQRLCYRTEAALYDDHTILAARLGKEVVGSVRARLEDGTCHVGGLVVHPVCRDLAWVRA